jgi:asparagine synthase (glutamine-hydrolysing)
MMKLYRAISEDGFRLVLTGDGADEIFGGYPRYKSQAKLPNLLRLRNSIVAGYMSKPRSGIHRNISNILSTQLSTQSHHKWSHWHWNMTPAIISQLRSGYLSSKKIDLQIQESIVRYQTEGSKSDVNSLMKLDMDLWLAMESNRKLDRISMRYSIEARSPFQDERVICAGNKLPSIIKSKDFQKEALWRAFPEMEKFGVRSDKTGFISPVGHWLRGNEKLVARLANQATSKFDLNLNYVSRLLQSPTSGNYREFMNLWSLIVLAAWEEAR